MEAMVGLRSRIIGVLRADAENRQKEGKGFFKMDKNNIGLIREDLEEDFRSSLMATPRPLPRS